MATTFIGALWAEITIPEGVTISVTNSGGGPTTVTITAGTYAHMPALVNQIQTDLNTQRTPSGWLLTESIYEAGSTGKLTIEPNSGVFSITWTSTLLRDLLGFASNISSQSTSTGTKQMGGVWLPDAPLFLASGTIRSAPRRTDKRQSKTPTGRTFSHVGNVRYEHHGLRYSHVANNRIWRVLESTTGESLETFWLDTQVGQGSLSSFFALDARVTIVAHDGNTVGDSTSADQWQFNGWAGFEDAVKRIDDWDGLWSAEWETISSDGSS